MRAVHEEDANRFLFTFADDIRIGISAADISEAPDVAEHLSKVKSA